MTRSVLSTLLCALSLAVGLVTAVVQSENRADAFELDEMQSECRMLESLNGAHRASVLALDWGPDAGELFTSPTEAAGREGIQ